MFGGVAVLLQHVHAAARLVVGVLLVVAAELDEQEALARRQQGEVGVLVALLLDVLEQQVVDPLQGGRLEGQDLRAGGRTAV